MKSENQQKSYVRKVLQYFKIDCFVSDTLTMEKKDRKRKQRLWNPVRLIYPVISRKLKEKQLKSGSRGKNGTSSTSSSTYRSRGVPNVSTPFDDDKVQIITRLSNRMVASAWFAKAARLCPQREEDKFLDTANGVSCLRIHLIRAFCAGDDLGVISHQRHGKKCSLRRAAA